MPRYTSQAALADAHDVERQYTQQRTQQARKWALRNRDMLDLRSDANYAWWCYRRGDFDINYIIGRDRA